MNVATHQDEKKNVKTGKRKEGEEKKQDFKEAACYPSVVIQVAARQKMVCVRGVPGVTGTLEKANSRFDLIIRD